MATAAAPPPVSVAPAPDRLTHLLGPGGHQPQTPPQRLPRGGVEAVPATLIAVTLLIAGLLAAGLAGARDRRTEGG